MPYYVVNAGRGRSTHIMKSKNPTTPNPLSPGSIAAELLWFGGNPKFTLCGLQATRYVNVFSPSEASCRECRRRWQLAVAPESAARRPVPGRAREQSKVQLRRTPKARTLIPALKPDEATKPDRCPRCGRRMSDARKHWSDGLHHSADGTGYCYCPDPGKSGDPEASPPAQPALKSERWTAAWRPDASAIPRAIGGYPDVGTARHVCEVHARHPLAWFSVPQVPEVVTAAIDGKADYAVVDRVIQEQRRRS